MNTFFTLYIFLALAGIAVALYTSSLVRAWAINRLSHDDNRDDYAPDSMNNFPDGEQTVLPATVLLISNTMLDRGAESRSNGDASPYNNEHILRMFPSAEPTRTSMLNHVTAVGRINSLNPFGPSTDASMDSPLANNNIHINSGEMDGSEAPTATQRDDVAADVEMVAVAMRGAAPSQDPAAPFGWPYVVHIGGRHSSNTAEVLRRGQPHRRHRSNHHDGEDDVPAFGETDFAPYGQAEYAVASGAVPDDISFSSRCPSPHQPNTWRGNVKRSK